MPKKKSARAAVEKPLRHLAHRRYNWVPDLPDQRDFQFAALVAPPPAVPSSVDLRAQCSPVFDQGKIGSCTGNALAGALEFLELAEMRARGGGPEVFVPGKFAHVSRLFIYYNERALEGTIGQDAGARLRDGIKSLVEWGACRESTWKYAPALVEKKPSPAAFKEAATHEISQYLRLASLNDMKQCLALGFPFVFGFTVYESFESPEVARTGVMPMPGLDERVLGGHAVMAVGYEDARSRLIVRNSWGPAWGMGGYFAMPYEYVTRARLAQDFWTVRR